MISIIIPTYNRAHLIGDTLDSISIQTFKYWECLIVDDGSIDYTEELIQFYSEKDPRFSFIKRPVNLPKGANACRNFGFDHSVGHYIIFFDSDDLMTADHLEKKMKAIQHSSLDYVISKTKYWNTLFQDEFYTFASKDISLHNYITQKVNWLTPDLILKRQIAETISFNDNLQSGQEFNYFAKLTAKSTKGILIDSFLTLRRYHEESVRGDLRKDPEAMFRGRFYAHWVTYLELKDILEKETRVYLVKRCVIFFFQFKYYYKYFSTRLYLGVYRELGMIKANYFILAILANGFMGKGYYFAKKVRT